MKGKILDFSIQNSSGIISGNDGQRYEFTTAEWKSDKFPKVGQEVDFVVENGKASSLYLIKTSNQVEDIFKDITKNGVHNIVGVVVSLLLAFSLFLKTAHLSYFGSISFMDAIDGKILFVLILGVAFLHYTGIKPMLTKIASILISVVMLYEYYQVLTRILVWQHFGLKLISFGTYVTIPLLIAFLILGLRAK